MTAEDFRSIALRFSGTVESEHMRHPDFRCRGRVFATLDYPDKGWGMVKLTPNQQRVHLRTAPRVFQPARGAWGKSGSTIIQLELAEKAVVKAALAAAFQNACHPGAKKKTVTQLLRFPGSVKRDPAIEVWMKHHSGELGVIARHWFGVMRQRGGDVRELLHDGHPTACVGDAAFAYVNAFRAHVNVGFFRGAEIADPKGLLEGAGKYMRHVKLRPGVDVRAEPLMKLIDAAHLDMKKRVRDESLKGGPAGP